MIQLLTSIPKEVIRDRIFPFFDALSLVRLDSATLSHEHRPNLLSHVLHDTVLMGDTTYSRNMVLWLASRYIHVQNIRFPPESEPEDIVLATPVLTIVDSISMNRCTKLTNECVQYMIPKCGALDSIEFGGCTWLNDQTLRIVADENYQLHRLILSDCPLVTDAGAAYILARCFVSEVQLKNCVQISELSMNALYQQAIEDLNIERCPGIKDAGVVKFMQGSNRDFLDSLILIENSQLTDLSLLAVAQYCPTLTELDISYCEQWTDAGLYAVIQSCQKLCSLHADGCTLSYNVLNQLCTQASPSLITLFINDAEALTEQHVAALVTRCPKLWELKFGTSDGLNDRALQSIGENLSELTCVTFDLCSNVRLNGIQALVQGCTQLEEIHLLMCPLVCDQCLVEIATHCKSLCYISITDNYNLTDAGVRALAQHCKLLERVCIDNTSITDVAVEHLIDCCPKLIILEMDGRLSVAQSLQRLADSRNIRLLLGHDEQSEFDELMQNAIDDADSSGVESEQGVSGDEVE